MTKENNKTQAPSLKIPYNEHSRFVGPKPNRNQTNFILLYKY